MDTPSKLPAQLFRFFGPPTAHYPTIQLFKYGRVIFSNPDYFNDPFDVFPRFDQFHKAKKELVEAEILVRKICNEAVHPDLMRKQEIVRQKITVDHPSNWRKNIGKEFAALCLSNSIESIVMWSHYSKNHQGIAVEFDSAHDFFQGFLAGVKYGAERPLAETRSERDAFARKSPEWAYEKEWRLVQPISKLKKLKDGDGNQWSYMDLPKGLILKIFIGWKCDNSLDLAELRRFKTEHQSVGMFKMRPSADRFGFEREEWS